MVDTVPLIAGIAGGVVLLCLFCLCCSCGLYGIKRMNESNKKENKKSKSTKNSKPAKKSNKSKGGKKNTASAMEPGLIQSPPAMQSQHFMQNPQHVFMPPNQIVFSAQPQPHQFLHSGAATVAYGTDDPRSVVYPSGSASVGGMPQAHHPRVIVIKDSENRHDGSDFQRGISEEYRQRNQRYGMSSTDYSTSPGFDPLDSNRLAESLDRLNENLERQDRARNVGSEGRRSQMQTFDANNTIASSHLVNSLNRANEALDRREKRESLEQNASPYRRSASTGGVLSKSEYREDKTKSNLKRRQSADRALNTSWNSSFKLESLYEHDAESSGSAMSASEDDTDNEMSINDRSGAVFLGNVGRREIFDIIIPPGVIGLVIDLIDDGWPVIRFVKKESSVANRVVVGDRIISIDGDDMRNMTYSSVSTILNQYSELERMMTVMR
mmetsp:Transcript_17894/g.37550  ORF Transcript_17894/g.37550 Transcript_17894/m.37550 type:complete len:439 (-) Transcript_17894:29-1345(-)